MKPKPKSKAKKKEARVLGGEIRRLETQVRDRKEGAAAALRGYLKAGNVSKRIRTPQEKEIDRLRGEIGA